MSIHLRVTQEQAEREIALCKNNILAHQKAIGQIFVDLGYANEPDDVLITIGPEVEVTQVAGQEAWEKRRDIVSSEMQEGAPRINSKKDDYMPQDAQVTNLMKKYPLPSRHMDRNNRGRKVLIEKEPDFCTNIADDAFVDKNNILQRQHVALSQIEFTFFPMLPIEVPRFINKIINQAIHDAADPEKGYDLRRLETVALPTEQTSPNGIHLNCVIGVKTGQTDKYGNPLIKNAFSQQEWTGKGEAGDVSDFALCVGKAHMEFLEHSLFMFARAESDYRRFAQDVVTGPSVLGMLPRKEHNNFGTAMFRGGKRKTERKNSDYKEKEDSGPLRFELRVPSPGAMGHPNKEAYPSQQAMTYEMIEAYMKLLHDGAKLWKKRELSRRRGGEPEKLTEQDLLPAPRLTDDDIKRMSHDEAFLASQARKESLLCPLASVARKNFSTSPAARSYWGKERKNLIFDLSADLDEIEISDRHPEAGQNKGPHVNRLLGTSNQPTSHHK